MVMKWCWGALRDVLRGVRGVAIDLDVRVKDVGPALDNRWRALDELMYHIH